METEHIPSKTKTFFGVHSTSRLAETKPCVAKTAKPPATPAPLFIRRGVCRVVTTLSCSVRAVEICQIQITRPRDCRRLTPYFSSLPGFS